MHTERDVEQFQQARGRNLCLVLDQPRKQQSSPPWGQLTAVWAGQSITKSCMHSRWPSSGSTSVPPLGMTMTSTV